MTDTTDQDHRNTPGTAPDNSPLVDLGFDGSLPRSFLRPALHIALLDGPTHGYELLEYVQCYGLSSVDLAGIYRTLRQMDHDEMVASTWEPSDTGPARRVYALTERGTDAAEGYLAGMTRARTHIDQLIKAALTIEPRTTAAAVGAA